MTRGKEITYQCFQYSEHDFLRLFFGTVNQISRQTLPTEKPEKIWRQIPFFD